jgi:hypothetical protein
VKIRIVAKIDFICWGIYILCNDYIFKEIFVDSLEAKAEIFFLAFKSMSKKEKDIILNRLVNDNEFREDLIDIALVEQRKNEPSYSFEEYLEGEANNDL